MKNERRMFMRKTTKSLFALMLAAAILFTLVPFAPANAVTEEKTFTTSVSLGGEGNVAGSSVSMPNGWAGMKITVGAADIKVTALGRWYTPESNGTHNFLIANTDGSLVCDYGNAVAVAAEGATEGFVYGALTTPVTLLAGTSYYIVSDYWGETDKFYSSAVSTHTDVATIDGIVVGTYNFYEAADIGWGPLDFKYEVEKPLVTPQDGRFVTALTNNAPGNVEGSATSMPAGWAGMQITVGAKDIKITSLGRWYTPESALVHNFLIANTDGSLVCDYGNAVASASAGTEEGFVYGALATPVVLKANTSYYIVSDYASATDKFYAGSVAETQDVATLDGIVILGDAWNFYAAPGTGWGPLDFEYEVIEPAPKIVYGDATGDVKVTSTDLTRLRRYLAGVEGVVVSEGADATGDGKVTSTDLTRLRRYLAGVEGVVLGPNA